VELFNQVPWVRVPTDQRAYAMWWYKSEIWGFQCFFFIFAGFSIHTLFPDDSNSALCLVAQFLPLGLASGTFSELRKWKLTRLMI